MFMDGAWIKEGLFVRGSARGVRMMFRRGKSHLLDFQIRDLLRRLGKIISHGTLKEALKVFDLTTYVFLTIAHRLARHTQPFLGHAN